MKEEGERESKSQKEREKEKKIETGRQTERVRANKEGGGRERGYKGRLTKHLSRKHALGGGYD